MVDGGCLCEDQNSSRSMMSRAESEAELVNRNLFDLRNLNIIDEIFPEV